MRFLQMRKSFHGQTKCACFPSIQILHTCRDHSWPFNSDGCQPRNTLNEATMKRKFVRIYFADTLLGVCASPKTHQWPFALRFYLTVMLMLRKWIKFWRAVHFRLNDSMNRRMWVKGWTREKHTNNAQQHTFLWIRNVKLIYTLYIYMCNSSNVFLLYLKKQQQFQCGSQMSLQCMFVGVCICCFFQNKMVISTWIWCDQPDRRYVGQMLSVFAYLLFNCVAVQHSKQFEILSFYGNINRLRSRYWVRLECKWTENHFMIQMFSFGWFHLWAAHIKWHWYWYMEIRRIKWKFDSSSLDHLQFDRDRWWIDIFE